ncbi:VapE domain-containing protein [Niameybacter massiliensis]|uniref:VapE domain-containing protein n=1 Tax=Niameybacter massiliensis TaxID=1658108 RepID=UPI0006B61231|nr:VapE domain-containing protein [Niameybacter massiliensis]
MEQPQQLTPNLSTVDFNDEKTYSFMMISDDIQKAKRHKLFEAEAIKRGQKDIFDKKVEDMKIKFKNQQPTSIKYECNARGTPLKIWENLKVLYDNKGIELQYNELKRCIESNQEWYMYDDFLTQINSDCRRTGLVLSKDDLWGFSSYIANTKAYNPIKQYLEDAHKKFKTTNAEVSELGKLLKTISYPNYYNQEDIKFNECMILKWLLTGAKMGLNNGNDNAEFSLVLKGKQGVGKTRWFRALMPKAHVKDFFKDGIQLDLSRKDDIIQATSYWLCELGELGGTMRKSDRDALKAWLTSPSDEVRTPYSRKAEKYPRRTFFACTVNDNEFLRDDTGNRRFVVIDVEKLDHTHNIDIDLMWGEVMELLLQGNKTYLEQNEIEYNNHRNKGYMVKSDEQMLLEEYLPLNQPKEQWGYITSTAICSYMEEVHGKMLKPRSVGKALSAMGFENQTSRINGSLGRYYKLPHLPNYSMPI